jgi:protoporphyrinogen oxidase
MNKVQVVLLGAGPSSLAAAYVLLKNGIKPLIIEKGKLPGGLMINVIHGDYSVDLGRKELYTRIKSVNDLWVELLGDDYKPYDYRIGLLYKDKVLEKTSEYKGFRRGLSWGQFISCILDFGVSFFRFMNPKNYEEHMYKIRGKKFTLIFSQTFFEKFQGRYWKDLPVPAEGKEKGQDANFINSLLKFFVDKNDEKSNQEVWRHPSRGAGQITMALEKRILEMGGEIWYETNVDQVKIEDKKVSHILVTNASGIHTILPELVISSIPLEFAGNLFLPNFKKPDVKLGSLNRGTLLIYLFIDETSKMEQTWINVSDPELQIGRITNYSGFGGTMVPKGKTCLCIEYFLFSDNPIFKNTDAEILELTLKQIKDVGLFDQAKIESYKILKFSFANAAVSWTDYLSEPYKVELFNNIRAIGNVYNVNRAGTDRATHAGIAAAESIIAGNKKDWFEKKSDPMLKEPWLINGN